MGRKSRFSVVRKERVEVSRLYEDGFLYLNDDPDVWIQSNPAHRLSSVRWLELDLCNYKGEEIGNSIGELSELTHLRISRGLSFKSLYDTISRLHNLQQLDLEELPSSLGDSESLTSLSRYPCPNLITKQSKLTSLTLTDCTVIELPANLGDFQCLTYLSVVGCDCLKSLPWSITKLSKLRILYLPRCFRIQTLPSHLDDSLLISVKERQIRKTWKKLKTEVELLSIPFPTNPVDVAHLFSTPGYYRLSGDPTPWIQRHFGLQSFVRMLDLDLRYLKNQRHVSESIRKLPELTHLYISHGCLRHLSPIFLIQKIKHLSLFSCDFDCSTEFYFDSPGKLSELVSLHLETDDAKQLPAYMHLPVNLRHLRLSSCAMKPKRLPDSYMTSISNLSNLKTLVLSQFCDLELGPLNLYLTKLILRDSTVRSLPMGLRYLEIMCKCKTQRCHDLICPNQLVNLETFSYTCYQTEVLPNITSLHTLQELQLKDCFKLKELPANLDELVKLRTLNVSGTRIKSLPHSITKLHNLRRLILPKRFMLESLPRNFENEVKISVDHTCEKYYKDEGYYDSRYDKGNKITSDTLEGVKEVVVMESRTENIFDKHAQHKPLNHLPDATQISESSDFPGRTDPISNDNHHTSSDSQDHDMDILPTGNKDGAIPFSHNSFTKFRGNTTQVHAPIELEVGGYSSLTLSRNTDCVATSVHAFAPESSSILYETSLSGENSREAFQNKQVDDINVEMQQGITPCNSIISVHGGSNYDAFNNEQVENSRSGKVKNKTQKIGIALETINSLKSQNMRLEAAAEQLGVSRSTMKRALKEHGITWPSTRRKLQDPSNQAGHGHGAEHLDGTNQLTLPHHVPSESNVVNDPIPDAVRRTVEEPPMSTQCHMDMDDHHHFGEYSNGVNECALWNSVEPNGSSSTFVVKAAYKKDTARFDFSLNSSIEKLKDEVGKSLELKVGKFKIKYLDDDKEWMLMNRISDLKKALDVSKSSGSNVVRLSIELKK